MDMVYTNAIIPTSWAHYHCLCYLYLHGCSWVIRWIPGTLPRINVHLYLCFCFLYILFNTTPSKWIGTIETYNALNLPALAGWNLSNHITNSTIPFPQHCDQNVKQTLCYNAPVTQNHSNLELRCLKWNHSINHSTNFCLAYTNLATRVESQRIVGQSPLSTLTIPGCR